MARLGSDKCPHGVLNGKWWCADCHRESEEAAKALSTSALLDEREKRYGDFNDVSRIVQTLKAVIGAENTARESRGQPPLAMKQVEALDCIAMKMARILSGDPDYADNWDDIAGYAKLCSTREGRPGRRADDG